MRIAVALVSVIALALIASPVEARPKKPVAPGQQQPLNNNCSHAQLNTDIGSQCVNQGTTDIIDGSSTYHFAYCSSSGAVLCCMTDGFRILDGSCSLGMAGYRLSPEPEPAYPISMAKLTVR